MSKSFFRARVARHGIHLSNNKGQARGEDWSMIEERERTMLGVNIS
jgi:hypothetical protein